MEERSGLQLTEPKTNVRIRSESSGNILAIVLQVDLLLTHLIESLLRQDIPESVVASRMLLAPAAFTIRGAALESPLHHLANNLTIQADELQQNERYAELTVDVHFLSPLLQVSEVYIEKRALI